MTPNQITALTATGRSETLGPKRMSGTRHEAVVLAGNTLSIEFEIPQCLLRGTRFRGVYRTEFLDNRKFHSNTFVLLASAERFLKTLCPSPG